MLQSRGSGTRRSNACWTCKLRRKKCDEAQPACLACVSRTITCHGYGPEKPQWMDGGNTEKRELDVIQHAVKANKRRQRKILLQTQAEARRSSLPHAASRTVTLEKSPVRRGMHVRQHRPSVSSRTETETLFSEPEGSTTQYGNILSLDPSPAGYSTKPPTPVICLANISLTTPEAGSINTPPTASALSPSTFRFSQHREAELLMHYLDVVFALQFRFHVPSVASGGRGWLLWLLNETKPLYHAALSLGALHQHSLLNRSARHETLLELNEHHKRAIHELQIFLQNEYDSNVENRGRKRDLQVLACGVQFISFELFRGGINVWDPHLRYLTTYLDHEWGSNGSQHASASPGGAAHDAHGLERTAEQFLTGSVLWFDIIACASTGKAPLMKASHDALLCNDRIQLANIVGCQAWVALLMGEIAQIQEDSRERKLDMWELVERGNPIRRRLMRGISDLRREIDETLAMFGQARIVLDPAAHVAAVTRAVTLAFAHATQVYLNTTVTGAFPYSQEIRSSVSDTAKALQEMRSICDVQASRSLVWPICIAGSMAEDPELQSFFRTLIDELGEQAHDFGNSVTVLRIMERCWSYWQNRTPGNDRQGYSWLSAMEETGQRVLLV